MSDRPYPGIRSAPDRSESLSRSGPRLGRLGFPIAGRRGGDQRVEQAPRGVGDIVDRAVERGLVGLRWLVEARDLAHELERGGPDLLVGGGRGEVEERSDVSAHDSLPRLGVTQRRTETDL